MLGQFLGKLPLLRSNFILVDPVNGSSSGVPGNWNAPYQTLAQAIAAYNAAGWTFGQILLAPGTYAQGATQVFFPTGSWVRGSGQGITILTSTVIASGSFSACFVPPAGNFRISDLTINCVVGDHNFRFPFGFGGDADTPSAPTNSVLENVTILGESDCLYFASELPSGTNVVRLYNCWLQSTWDTLFLDDGSDIWYYGCRLLATGPSDTAINGNQLHSCCNIALGNVHLLDCDLEASSPGAGFCRGLFFEAVGNFNDFVEMRGGKIITFNPGFISRDWEFSQSEMWLDQMFFVLHGVEYYNPPATALSASYPNSIQAPANPERVASTLTVTSSACTPYYLGGNQIQHASANASSLSANTLTINPPICQGKLQDGSILNLALSNTNATGVAMTLAFNTSSTAQNAVHLLNIVDSGGTGNLLLSFDNGAWNIPDPAAYSATVAALAPAINAQLFFAFPSGAVTCTGTTLANLSLNYTGATVNARNVPLVQATVTGSGFTVTPSVTTAGSAPGYNLGGQTLATVPPGKTIYLSFVFNTTSSQFELERISPNISSTPICAARADLTAKTAAQASVCTFTPPSNGTFEVGAYASVTAIATDTLQVEVTFTDENSTARTLILPAFSMSGLALASNLIIATGYYTFPRCAFRAKGGTAITVATVLPTSSGTITYDVGAVLEQKD